VIGSRLAAALAACAHLSWLGAAQRMWSLQTLRTLMTSGYGLSLNIPALVATSDQAKCLSVVYSVADPGSGAFLTSGTGIRDRLFPDVGSPIQILRA
jgi:hypothetical protein